MLAPCRMRVNRGVEVIWASKDRARRRPQRSPAIPFRRKEQGEKFAVQETSIEETKQSSSLPNPLAFDEIRRATSPKRRRGGPLKAAKCFCCGSGLRLSNHHIEPRAEGGSDGSRNKVTRCSKCHDVVEGQPWSAILAHRESIRTERYAQRYERRVSATEQDWIGRSPIEKVVSIRRYCLTRGVLEADGTTEDFRQAFRTLNRLHNELQPRLGIITASRNEASRPVIPQGMGIITQKNPLREKIDRLLWEGTQEEWVAAIVELANS